MNEDLMIKKLISLEEKVDNLEKNMGKVVVKVNNLDVITESLDEIKEMLTKKDIEQTATIHALKRHEKRIEILEKHNNIQTHTA
ncbi:MAG: hypothetical protein COU32_02190 [Candidatus Magasanikbacteria bacterium CG10_big_fil_rev_8_21_14_0_10_42_10]|uniref:Uncharacterized protein n=2 Tax=Candidatus Magasanikiibacteriota TaxID=1752731 RepID=A0A2H0TWA9_9BACT|nr:MAG: hypothetical protein COU32_02190 [Candidatus Magasanikbacteria bacterium CG10_big_fil_rev_8_21_14_0_10_42_10]PIZ93680.1 MAG: hypothetical protein COX82_02195 [Candidatus Magasanikbacteria bacterium CG_4_10_14_0_2_um_filter_41_10]